MSHAHWIITNVNAATQKCLLEHGTLLTVILEFQTLAEN